MRRNKIYKQPTHHRKEQENSTAFPGYRVEYFADKGILASAPAAAEMNVREFSENGGINMSITVGCEPECNVERLICRNTKDNIKLRIVTDKFVQICNMI